MDMQQVFNNVHMPLLITRTAASSWRKGMWGLLCKFNVVIPLLFILELGYAWETCVKDLPTSGKTKQNPQNKQIKKQKKPTNKQTIPQTNKQTRRTPHYTRGCVFNFWKSLDSKRTEFGRRSGLEEKEEGQIEKLTSSRI